jgi:urease accessory protein
MLTIERRLEGPQALDAPVRTLHLAYGDRCRSRLRARLEDGAEVGLFLARGTVLRGDDVLEATDGTHVLVTAAPEALYEVLPSPASPDPSFDLLRAAYHLGNRHVPVQLAPGRLRLERDAVLRDLLRGLAMEVREIVAPFEPEAGAYGGGHRHDHDASGGVLGELLSREAHARAIPDLSRATFLPVG